MISLASSLSQDSKSLSEVSATSSAGSDDDMHKIKRHTPPSIANNDEEAGAPLLKKDGYEDNKKMSSLSIEEDEDSKKIHEDPCNRNVKLFFCFLGLQVSYVLWGVAQEQIMTHVYKPGKFTSSAFCVFGNRFLALILSFGCVIYNKYTKPKMKEAPPLSYIPSSLSNSISSWAQYEALKYLSFPTQLLSKSCKIIPVMLVGILVNKKSYPMIEYLEALAITLGVAIFTFSEKSASTEESKSDSVLGIILIVSYLACDSFTSQWQSKIYKQYGVDQYQMMFGINFWSLFFTGISLIHSGEGYESIVFIMADSLAMYHQVILSITSAVGQLFIFYTIKEFGPVIFTIMMTTRQIFSLFLSCILFSHPLSLLSWVGALLVFCVVFYRVKRKGTD